MYNQNWDIKKLIDICDITLRQSPPSSSYTTKNAGLPFFQGKAEFGEKYPIAVKYCTEPKKIAKKEDILISVRTPVGDLNIALDKCCIGRGLAAIRPKTGTIQGYVYHFLNRNKNYFHEKSTGSTFRAISGSVLKNIEIPLPPLPTQQKIVDKIESLFSKIDSGNTSLQKAKVLLEQYRQSVLKAAFEGKLTAQWREEHKGELEPASVLLERIREERKKKLGKKYKELPPVDTIELPELPEGWCWCRLEEITDVISDGDHQAPPKSKSGIPFIVIGNLKNNDIDFTNTRFVPIGYYEKLDEKRRPQKDDILYSVTGSYGIPVLLKENKKFCFQRHIGLIRVSKSIFTKFVYNMLLTPQIYKQATDVATGVAQLTVPLGGIRKFVVPLPPILEQQYLCLRLEQHLSSITKIENEVFSQLEKNVSCRQSILKSAFEGKLVKE